MKLFEATFRQRFDFFERYYDTELQKSVTRQLDGTYEWYEPFSKGHYTSILDDTQRFDKRYGSAKKGRDHFGFTDPMVRNIRDNYWKDGLFNTEPRIWYLDIETRVGQNSTGFPVPEKAAEQISLIQIYDNKEKVMYVLGLRDWKHKENYNFDYEVKYMNCKDEITLLRTYNALFQKLDPLIIYAWNGLGFDFPYIYTRLKNLGFDTDVMSNHGSTNLTIGEFQGKTEFKLRTDGHFYIDLMEVYQKFVFSPRASYSLDFIAEVELKERKVQHTEYAGFDDFYTGKYIIPNNPSEEQKNSLIYQEAVKGNWDEVKELAHSEFVYYGIKDTYLIKRIDEKRNFTALMSMIAKKMGVQLSETLGTVKPWSTYIANRSLLNNQVLPPKKDVDDPHIVGGFVRNPVAGKHKWILSEDVNSMYPLLGMVGFNMSPETFKHVHELPPELRDIVLAYFNDQEEEKRLELPKEVWNRTTELLNEHNLSLGINGAVFTKEKRGMIPELVQDIYDSRKKAKKTMFKYQQRKVLIKEILKEM